MKPENGQFGREDARYFFLRGLVPHSYRSSLDPSDSYDREALKWQRRGLKTRIGVEALVLVGGALAASYYLPFIIHDGGVSVTNIPSPPGVISPESKDTSQPIIASPASLPTLTPGPESTVIFHPTPEPIFVATPTPQSEVLPDIFSLDKEGNILHEGKYIPPPPLASVYRQFQIEITQDDGKPRVTAFFRVSDKEVIEGSGVYPTVADVYDLDNGCWLMASLCGNEAQLGGGWRDVPAKIPDYSYQYQPPKQLKGISSLADGGKKIFILPGVHLGDNSVDLNQLQYVWGSDGYVWRFSETVDAPILTPYINKAVYHDDGSITYEPSKSSIVYDLAVDITSIEPDEIIPLTFQINDKIITTPLAIKLTSDKSSYILLYRTPYLDTDGKTIQGFTWGFYDMNFSANVLASDSTKNETLENTFTFLRAKYNYGLGSIDIYNIVGQEPTTEALAVLPAHLRVVNDGQGKLHIQVLELLDILLHPNLQLLETSGLNNTTQIHAFASKAELLQNSGRPSAAGRERQRAQQSVMRSQSRSYKRI